MGFFVLFFYLSAKQSGYIYLFEMLAYWFLDAVELLPLKLSALILYSNLHILVTIFHLHYMVQPQ